MFLLLKSTRYRRDGLSWKRREDGSRLENHETLKMKKQSVMRCTYMFSDDDRSIQRRCYTLLRDSRVKQEVLIHYRRVERKGARRSAGGSLAAPAMEADGMPMESSLCHESVTVPAVSGVRERTAAAGGGGRGGAGDRMGASGHIDSSFPLVNAPPCATPGPLSSDLESLGFPSTGEVLDTNLDFLLDTLGGSSCEMAGDAPREEVASFGEAMDIDQSHASPMLAVSAGVMPAVAASQVLQQAQAAVPITDYSPIWDWETGGAKVILVVSVDLPTANVAYTVSFGDVLVQAEAISTGAVRCYAPPHSPAGVLVSIQSDGVTVSNQVQFEYRRRVGVPFFPAAFDVSAFDQHLHAQVTRIHDMVVAAQAQAQHTGIQEEASAGQLARAVNLADSRGMTLLHYAVVAGASQSVKLLLTACGADPSLQDARGCTALHLAATIMLASSMSRQQFLQLVHVRAGWAFRSQTALEMAAGTSGLQAILDYLMNYCTGPGAAKAGVDVDDNLDPDVLSSRLMHLVLQEKEGEEGPGVADIMLAPESRDEQISSSIRILQAAFRSHRARANYVRGVNAAIMIQKSFRSYHMKKKARKESDAAKRILSAYRYYRFKKQFGTIFDLAPPTMEQLAEQTNLKHAAAPTQPSFDFTSLLDL